MRTIGDREDIRESILDAATRLMDRFGYRKTTMDDLAREAEIGKGTIYLHFRSKEDVALCVSDRMHRRLFTKLEAIAAEPCPAPRRLQAMLRTRILYLFDQFEGVQQRVDELFRDLWPVVMVRRETYDATEASLLERVIRDGVLRGELACDDPDATARALIWATNSQLPYSLTPKQLRERAVVGERVDAIASILVAGLRTGSRARTQALPDGTSF